MAESQSLAGGTGPAADWGVWEDVTLFGVAFFTTLYAFWLVQPPGFFFLDAPVGAVTGTLAVVARRRGYLKRLTRDGGTSFFRAAIVFLLTPIVLGFVLLGLLEFDAPLAWPLRLLLVALGGALAVPIWRR